MGETQSAVPGSGTPYALNNRLSDAEAIGLGELEGPEDVILDRDDNLYCGTRHGEIVRFFAPDYKRSEVFAHIGGFPLGLAFDRAGNLISCVGAMGLYAIARDGEVTSSRPRPTRSWTSIVDDARLRDPNDSTSRRTGASTSPIPPPATTPMTGRSTRSRAAPPGGCSVYDPRSGTTTTLLDNYRYANGVCMAHDGKSLFFAESWACRVHRYWLEGRRPAPPNA